MVDSRRVSAQTAHPLHRTNRQRYSQRQRLVPQLQQLEQQLEKVVGPQPLKAGAERQTDGGQWRHIFEGEVLPEDPAAVTRVAAAAVAATQGWRQQLAVRVSVVQVVVMVAMAALLKALRHPPHPLTTPQPPPMAPSARLVAGLGSVATKHNQPTELVVVATLML